ncbi:MAG: GDP-mannose 4,6-dehydratase [Acidobacteria bacterium]|nr:GDP-mannose 4,6-dehydratase [Acidobacteriota bacterium]
MGKSAFITGVTGQDGSYLAELLIEKGYNVTGLVRRNSNPNLEHLKAVRERVRFVHGDILDQRSLIVALEESQPDEVYNFAAQSFVGASWTQPVLTGEATALGVTRILEAIRTVNPKIRLYQASSSEMYGKVREVPQTERTPFHPRSPYGVAKAYGHYITVNYRESFQMHASSGICFNHESPRRGLEFVTRKISNAVARIKHCQQKELKLGNIEASRDWGYAGDYVKAMWLMLQQTEPDDYVIATGETHSVREFLEIAFSRVGLNWQDHVKFDQNLMRPAEVDHLVGDASLAREKLGWKPTVTFQRLVESMVDADMERVGRGENHWISW